MGQSQKSNFSNENNQNKSNDRDISSKSGQSATDVNKTGEMQSQHGSQGQRGNLRTVGSENQSPNRQEDVDDEDENIVGEKEDQEKGDVRNFKDQGGSESRQ